MPTTPTPFVAGAAAVVGLSILALGCVSECTVFNRRMDTCV
ncbi:MAG: hypothetical protein ACREJ3_10260 [Polyangiaceae bacterium]